VRRREFITGFGSIAAAWPLAGLAQPADRMRRVGVLLSWPEPDARELWVTDLARELGRFGWLDGENIRFEYRFASGNPTLFKPFAAELVGLAPDVILAMTPLAVMAGREQTHTIPIVFAFVLDPVGLGFVQSLARPGGKITGFGTFDAPLMGKWVQFLKEIAPRVTRVAVIFNPDTAPYAPLLSRAIEAGARSSGLMVTLAPVRDEAEIEEAIATHAHEPVPKRPSMLDEVQDQIRTWLDGEPTISALEVLRRLKLTHPDRFSDRHLRTVQRAVKAWRSQQARRIIAESAAVIVPEIRVARALPDRHTGTGDHRTAATMGF
jgi:hypothetical protein